MKRNPILLLGASLLLLATSCRSAPGEPSTFERSFPAGEVSTVTITMDRGTILVTDNRDTQTDLEITAHSGSNPSIQQINDQLVVDFQESKPGDRIELQVSGEPGLDIQAFDSLIEVISSQSELQIRNTAGDILLDDYQGTSAILWAGRGNVTVQNGEGKLVIAGEHGNLIISNFDGQLAAATIMGKIQYQGIHQGSADIILEADHGPIQASLPATSSYRINITSASGEIICSGPDLTRTSEGCQGVTEDGLGSFNIRTVSGRIEFRIPDQH